MSEVHGLPGVEDDRPLGGDMGRAARTYPWNESEIPLSPAAEWARRPAPSDASRQCRARLRRRRRFHRPARYGDRRASIGPNLAVAAPSEVDGGHRAGLLGRRPCRPSASGNGWPRCAPTGSPPRTCPTPMSDGSGETRRTSGHRTAGLARWGTGTLTRTSSTVSGAPSLRSSTTSSSTRRRAAWRGS